MTSSTTFPFRLRQALYALLSITGLGINSAAQAALVAPEFGEDRGVSPWNVCVKDAAGCQPMGTLDPSTHVFTPNGLPPSAIFYPEQYVPGTYPPDGRADNRAAIQAAMNACAARGGGEVHLRAAQAKWTIGAALTATEGCKLKGDGWSVPGAQEAPANAVKTTILALPSLTNAVMLNIPMRTFAPYAVGTITVTVGSASVTCSGCNFSANLPPLGGGMIRVANDAVTYTITQTGTATATLSHVYIASAACPAGTCPALSYTADSQTITQPAIGFTGAEDITFDGGKDAGAGVTCINYQNGDPSSIANQQQDSLHYWHNVAVINCLGFGMYIGPDNRGVQVDHLYAFNNGIDGLRVEVSDTSIRNLIAGRNGVCGLNAIGATTLGINHADNYGNLINYCFVDSPYFQTAAGGGALPTSGVTLNEAEGDSAVHEDVAIGGYSYGVKWIGGSLSGGSCSAGETHCSNIQMASNSTVIPAIEFFGTTIQGNNTNPEYIAYMATGGFVGFHGVTFGAALSAITSSGKLTNLPHQLRSYLSPDLMSYVDGYGHLGLGGPAPATPPTSCGTGSPTVSGTDNQFLVTFGGGTPTACTVAFGQAWSAVPKCSVTTNSATITGGITSLSTTQAVLGVSASFPAGVATVRCSE